MHYCEFKASSWAIHDHNDNDETCEGQYNVMVATKYSTVRDCVRGIYSD